MSGLGQKVKEILHKDRSNDDATPHPPGSFPTEDMEPSDTREGYSKKHEHNKLHKTDDPRGWTESDKDASRSHGYKDSGVGMTGSEDRTSYKPGQENMSERRDESFADRRDDTLGGRRDDTVGGRRDDALDRTTESSTMGQKDPLAPSTQEHPYWGDLPSQGGVHNSVIGHGSPEDEARRHRDVHSGATEATHNPSSTLESGTFLSRRDRDDSTRNTDPHAARPGEQMRPEETTSSSHYKEGLAGAGAAGAGAYGAHKLNERRDRDDTLGNTEPYGSRPGDQTRPDERTSDSHYKEGLAGAGAAGAGAYGAHKLNERRHDKDEPRQYDQTTDRTQPEEHKQRSFPLLGKDHKEPKEHKEHKEHHHHEKVKDDKEKESKLGGLFHRKDKDDTERVGDYDNDKHHHSKTGPALGAAGAAGAAGAYAATRDRHDDDNRRDNTARNYQDPSATQHTTKYPAAGLDSSRDYNTQGTNPSSGGASQMPYRQQDIDSHRGRDIATGAAGGAAAGLGAGALASHYGRRDDDHTANQRGTGFDNQSYDPSATSQQSGSQHMHGLSAPAVADERYDAQANQPTNFSHKDPMGQNQQHDSHRGAGLAAGTAAGLGAGALASRSGRDHDRDDRAGLESNHGYENQSAYPTEGSAMNPSSRGYDQQHDSHRGTGMAAGTAAGLGAAGLASHTGRDHDRNERSGLGSNQGFQSQDPYSSERSAMNPGSQSYEQHDSHRGMGLGAGTAAGLGAGALASRAGRDHDEKSGLGSNRGFNSQDPYSSERSAMNPGSQDAYSSERSAMNPGSEQRDSHRGAGLATGAAAGLGAGALASHAADHRRENDQFNTGDNSRGFQSQSGMTGTGLGNQAGMTGMGQNTGLGNQSGMTENTGMMGNTSGLGNNSGNDFSNKQSMPGAQPQRESEPFTEHKKEHDHTLMDNANSGKYNKLSSGTPSGIAYD